MHVGVFEMDTPSFITAETNDSASALFCFYLFPVRGSQFSLSLPGQRHGVITSVCVCVLHVVLGVKILLKASL